METITNTGKPELKALNVGEAFKVLQVSGEAGMTMPPHHCTGEAVLIPINGEAVMNMDGKQIPVVPNQPLVIPKNREHFLSIITAFRGMVVMPVEAEILFNRSA